MSVSVLWRRTGYRTLLVGQTVSSLGDWMGTVAFMALVLQQSGSSTAVGGILALRLLPGAIGGPLAARAVSRWDRRRVMVAMDVVRAAIVVLVPLVNQLWWIYIWAFSIEVASLVFLPARDASIPDLVDNDDLPLANGLVLGTSYGTIPLGAALFALVTALPGHELLGRPFLLVFWLDAASFVVSALLIARLTQLSRETPAGAVATRTRKVSRAKTSGSATRSASRSCARSCRPRSPSRSGWARCSRSASCSCATCSMRATRSSACSSHCSVSAQSRDCSSCAPRPSSTTSRATRIGVAALGAIVAAFSLAPFIGLAFVGAAAFGAAAAWTLASGMGALQSRLEGNERVLAFSAFHVVIRCGLAVAAIGAGVAGELVDGVRWPIVGTLEPARLVLFWAGILVLLSAMRVRVRTVDAA